MDLSGQEIYVCCLINKPTCLLIFFSILNKYLEIVKKVSQITEIRKFMDIVMLSFHSILYYIVIHF